jgi:dynein intermediate chain
LTVPSHNKTDEVSITCLDFPTADTSTFWIGTEEGSIYQANRYDRASAKAGLVTAPDDIYRGHAGTVTGLDFHPGTGSGGVDFSDLFLSCSVDWTIKLWRGRGSAGSKASASGGGGVMPIHSFEEADDYVFDVRWHPHHPGIFGSVDGAGKFDLWNLNQDVEVSCTTGSRGKLADRVKVPVVSTQVCDRALNKLKWDKTPLSRKVGMGGADGKLYVYDVAEKVVTPRDSEWTDMQKTVQGLTARGQSMTFGSTTDVPPSMERRYSSR